MEPEKVYFAIPVMLMRLNNFMEACTIYTLQHVVLQPYKLSHNLKATLIKRTNKIIDSIKKLHGPQIVPKDVPMSSSIIKEKV